MQRAKSFSLLKESVEKKCKLIMQIHRLPLVLALKFYGLALVPYIAGAHCPRFYALRRTRMNLEFMRVFTYLFIYLFCFLFGFLFFSDPMRSDSFHYSFHFA